MAGNTQEWQNILTTIQNSANDVSATFVGEFSRAINALTEGETDQVCLIRVGNSLRVEWEPSAVARE